MKRSLVKRLALGAAVLMMVFALMACSSGGDTESSAPAESSEAAESSAPAESSAAESSEAPAESEVADAADISGTLTLYTSEPEELVYDMIDVFNETYPNIDIEVFRSGTGKVTAKMDAELEAGETPANILWFADVSYISNLDDQGMIMHYTPANMDIDEQYAYNDGMGHEVRLIYNVLAYNTNEVTGDAPKDYFDITTEEYDGSFAMASPNYSGGAFSALVVHTQYPDVVGWDWYQAMYDNNCKYEESNGNLQTKVSSGEYKAVAIVDFMARNARDEGSPVEVVYPESGAVLVPTPMSLMNNIPEDSVDAAKAFVDWCFTDEAQALMVGQGYIPVTDTAGPEGAPTKDEINVLPFDLDYFLENSSAVREEYTERFGGAEVISAS